ncbi:MAG TPA: haloacid dehalogenase-like hydrolase [Longimicrobium sp.]|nr:haloacid dehalogenase-like hydrolase [Longimicrobium sp.]
MRRLVLFDIDGTLLRADGAGKRAIRDALARVFGTAGNVDGYPFAGRTDPQIVRTLLGGAGVPPERIDAGLEALWQAYVANLEREIVDTEVRALPGVPALLDRVEAGGTETVLGLLTGNLAEGARIKLRAAGLDPRRFRVGAFGSDHAERPELPAVAVRRARELTGVDYAGKQIVVIGDTPHDVSCGAHLGVRTIATATGGYTLEELAACGPDYLFLDLADTERVWRAIADD